MTWRIGQTLMALGCPWEAAQILNNGNISNDSRQLSAAGISAGATGADNVLAVYSLPANALDHPGAGIEIFAEGKFAANNNAKDLKIIFNPATAVVGSTVGAGGTTICDTGSLTTTANATGWNMNACVFKYGALGSNTQMCFNLGVINGNAHLGIAPPVAATAVENAAILIAVTANCTTAATDALLQWLEVESMT